MTRVRRAGLLLGCWLLLALGYTGYVGFDERRELASALRTGSAALLGVVSQRADQHDAHLTALSALALTDAPSLDMLFAEVASAIRTFYPRVAAIDLVPVRPERDAALTTREAGASPYARPLRALVATIAAPTVIRPPGAPPGRYLLVKRVPSDPGLPARFALALEIDAGLLLRTDDAFWRGANVGVTLALPGGDVLLETGAAIPAAPGRSGRPGRFRRVGRPEPLRVAATLGSRTQPLSLTALLQPRPADLLPVTRVIGGLVALLSLSVAAWAIGALLRRARVAELRARVGEHDARLSHAGRINALGEMASGIAHELTQPLTALLSQSQASLRLLDRDPLDGAVLGDALRANVMQARRAAAILARLRTWTRPSSDRREPVDVDACLGNVALLLDAEAKRAEVDLVLELCGRTPCIAGDAVALEQVVFNLVRNGMDAMAGQHSTRRVRMVSEILGMRVVVSVIDSGPGIDPSMTDRLFEPFASGKPGGMGLGLALCERIVERMDGEIEIRDAPRGGVVARLDFPCAGAPRDGA